MARNPVNLPDLTRPAEDGGRGAVIYGLAAGFSVLWALGVGMMVWSGLSPSGFFGILVSALVVLLPVALTFYVAVTVNTLTRLRDEAAEVRHAMESLRASQSQQAQAAAGMRPAQRPEAPFEDSAVPFTSRRDLSLTVPSADRKAVLAAPRAAARGEEQPALALGTPMDEPGAPLAMADFLRAVHFPENPDDAEGFRALRLALADRTVAKLIRAAQDVLTLLAQEGIYMDDLNPDRARPELWRKFAGGERGRAIAGLGAVRDRSCLALTAVRMREDAVFRDAAHHFLRSFDKAIAAVEPRATDTELSDLSDTRTARAFMLFGRVMGTFD
jgi:hypothetical protein